MKALLVRAAAVASVSLAIDQLTKVFARASLALCTTHGAVGCERIDLVAGSELIRVRNAGSALGFAHDLWIWVPIALAGLTLVLVYARAGGARAPIALAAGLQIGGAIGNLADRVFLGGATDFIYLGAGPVFNLADVFLALGTVIATRALWRGLDTNRQPLNGGREPGPLDPLGRPA